MKKCTTMLLGLIWSIATAAAEDEEERDGDEIDPQEVTDAIEVLIVTGTRMKLPPAQQVNNVITLTADDLEIMGVATVEEVFNRLPQNIFGGTQAGGANSTSDYVGGGALETFNGTANVTAASTVNLRGIGERGTLILVDGKRIGESGLLGGFSDISSIPMVMVERVDILLDGASVIYGPDAIGGVVNIVLRKDFKGTYVRVRHDAPVEAGQSQQTASIATTYGWDRGSLTGTLSYFRTGAMDLSDSNIATAETLGVYTPYGTVTGSGYPPPQPIMSLTTRAQELGVVPQGESVYSASVPHNANGTPSVADFLETANNPTLNPDTQTGDDLIPARTNYNVRFDLRQELAAGIGLQSALQYAPRRTTTSRYNSPMNLGVPAENPHNPFGELVLLTKYLPEYPDMTTRANSDAWTVDMGLDGDMTWKWFDGWDWRLEGRYSLIDTQTTILNEIRRLQIDAQLRGQTQIDDNGVYRRSGNYRDREDGLFLNPFGPSLADVNPQALADEILAPPQRNDTSTELTTWNAFVRGEAFELPAGSVQLVLGVERRNKVLDFQYRTTETRLTLVCPAHTATIAVPGTRIPKYSQHLNLGWEHRGLRLNVDFGHREDVSQLGGGRTGREWVTENHPVNINLSGAYDFDAGNLFGVPSFLQGTTLRFGLNDLLDHRTKITFNGETDDYYNRGVSFLDYSNRTYYVEIATTLTGLFGR